MEKIYYKGQIVNIDKLKDIMLELGNIENKGYSLLADIFLDYLNKLNYNVRKNFTDEIKETPSNSMISLSNMSFAEIKSKINDMFIDYYNLYKKIQEDINIIYELITNENGDLYGKELLTGLLFPIATNDKIQYRMTKTDVKHAILSVDGILFFINTKDRVYTDSKYYYCNSDDKKNTEIIYNTNYDICNFQPYFRECNNDSNKFYPINLTVYSLNPIIKPFENLNLCEAIIFNHKVANKNEIKEYTNRFKGLLKNSSKKKFIQNITTQYNKNIFNSEIKEKEPAKEVKKTKIEKDKITLKLENIEYLLARLKSKNNDMYLTYLKEYNEFINSEDKTLTLTPITLESLTLLEGKIEFYLNYSKNINNNISDLLNDLKNEYLDNFQNNKDKTTKLTIVEIDKLYELFLKTRNEYLLKDQIKILKDIALLYVMETIEDENIKISDLENSYFIDNLKYIAMSIMSLIDDDIIKDNILINLDDELNVQNIYNTIKNIEFKKNKTKSKK